MSLRDIDLLFFNAKVRENEIEKSKIGRLNLKNITSAQNQKRKNTFHELSIQLVSNIHSEPFSEFLFARQIQK